MGSYVQKLTGNILFDFPDADSLYITSDNNVFNKSQLGLDSTSAYMGYGSGDFIDFSAAKVQLTSIGGSIEINTVAGANRARLKTTNLTSPRIFEFPDVAGTLALVGDLGSYVQKLTGSVLFDFPAAGKLNISTDNGAFLQSSLQLLNNRADIGFNENFIEFTNSDIIFYTVGGSNTITVPQGVTGTLALTSALGSYVQLLTGNILFQFPNANTLYLTNDNGVFLKSYLGLELTSSYLGFDANAITIGSGQVTISSDGTMDLVTQSNQLTLTQLSSGYHAYIDYGALTTHRTYLLPDAGGTVALAELAYISVTSTYAVVDINRPQIVEHTSGTFTTTLFTAVGNTGKQIYVKNTGGGVITIACTGGELIDGISTLTLVSGDGYQLVSNGAGWIKF